MIRSVVCLYNLLKVISPILIKVKKSVTFNKFNTLFLHLIESVIKHFTECSVLSLLTTCTVQMKPVLVGQI